MKILSGRWFQVMLLGVSSVSSASPLTKPVGDFALLQPATRCRLSVSSPVVDFGMRSRWQLQDDSAGGVTMGTRTLSVAVICPHAQTMTLLIQGGGSDGEELRYGRHGVTHLRLRDAELDGNPVELQEISPAGALTGKSGQTISLVSGQRLVPVVQGQLAGGKMLTMRMEVQPVLSASDARVTGRQVSESMLTITLVD